MKKIIWSVLILYACCSENKDSFVPEKFKIERTTVELPFQVEEIIQFEDGYVFTCSDTSCSIGFLNKDFSLNIAKSEKLKNGVPKYLDEIWTSSNKLYGVSENYSKHAKYCWQNNNWKLINSGAITKQNWRSTELNYPIYEDNEFLVRSCCRGEFGGAIFFKEKKTDRTFSCEATCLNSIQKFNGAYFIASSLGSSKIFKIDDPRKLYEIKDTAQLEDCGWYLNYSNDGKGSYKKGYNKGYDVLLDTFDIHFLGGFNFENHLYYIYSDVKKTYVGYLKNKKLVALETIINKFTYYPGVRDLKNNPNIFPIRSQEFKGLLVLHGKNLKVVEFKRMN